MSLWNFGKNSETKVLSKGPLFLALCASVLLAFVWAGISYRVHDMRTSALAEAAQRTHIATEALGAHVEDIGHTLMSQARLLSALQGSEGDSPLGVSQPPAPSTSFLLYSDDGLLLSGTEQGSEPTDAIFAAAKTELGRATKGVAFFQVPGEREYVYFATKPGPYVVVFKLEDAALFEPAWVPSLGSAYVVDLKSLGGGGSSYSSGLGNGVPEYQPAWYSSLIFKLPPYLKEVRQYGAQSSFDSITLTVFAGGVFSDIEYRSDATVLMGVIMSCLIFLVMGLNFFLLNKVRVKHRSLIRLVTVDSLTELPNRRFLNDSLELLFEGDPAQLESAGLLFVDLDNFKPVNDAHGHKMGDMLLRAVARRLVKAAGSSGRICRLGGDEFAIIVNSPDAPDGLRRIAHAVVDSFSEPFVLDGIQINAAASVGLAYAKGCKNSSELLKNADMAMYDAKNAGKGKYREYSFEMAQKAIQEEQLGLALRPALNSGQFRLVYQPKISTFTGKVSGYEALLRWWHPQLGAISPGVFVPLSEANGLIHELGGWVIADAVRQIKEWHATNGIWHVVAVNVSAIQLLDPFLVGKIKRLLDTHGVPAASLQVELTESVLAANVENAQKVLRSLRQLGVKIAIDDFGTGYSSLNSLQRFDIDYLKVDQSFVKDIGTDSGNKICKSIVSLAHSLNLVVIAEGVETRAQFDALFELGCDELQGFLLSKPLPGAVAPTFNTDSLGIWQELTATRESSARLYAGIDMSSAVSGLQVLEQELASGFDALT